MTLSLHLPNTKKKNIAILYKTMNPIIYISEHLPTDYPIVYKQLSNALVESTVELAFLPYSKEVWARDFMPVHIHNGEYLGFRFRPDYLYDIKGNRKYITEQDKAVRGIPISYSEKTCAVFDGGNFVFCDDKVIMTDKIFQENYDIRQSKLMDIIENACNAELIIIPWDTLEPFGHADGMVSYVGNGHILFNNYSQMRGGKDFAKRLHKILSHHFEVTELSYKTIASKGYSCFYINYLDTPNNLLLPALSEDYSLESDMAALETFRQIFNKPIKQVYVLPLIKDGGALHCVTWELFPKI